MASKYSVILYSKDTSGKELSKTISDINPAAQPSELKAMAQGLNSLTTNVYQSADRVARENVDTATDKGTRSLTWKYSADGSNYIEIDPSTMEIPASAISQSNAIAMRMISVTGEDGIPFFSLPSGVQLRYGQVVWVYGGPAAMFSLALPSNSPQDLVFTVRFDETEKFVAFEKTFTFHLVGGE